VAGVEGDGEFLIDGGPITGRDAGDEGMMAGVEVEEGFGAHHFDQFDGGLDDLAGIGAQNEGGIGDVFGAESENDGAVTILFKVGYGRFP
jgi:hypothetical protein